MKTDVILTLYVFRSLNFFLGLIDRSLYVFFIYLGLVLDVNYTSDVFGHLDLFWDFLKSIYLYF